MTTKLKTTKPINKSSAKPFVSLCTPTFNRRPFIRTMMECFKNQDYPADRMEWIIVDDGSDPVRDIIEASKLPQIKYVHIPEKMVLGKKRNYMHSLCRGEILVYFDDDDYYPPERVSHAVETLANNPGALCAGSSEIYVFFPILDDSSTNQMIQFGPYHGTHATAGTFAFRRELLSITRYNDDAALAEEKEFLKNYSIPMAQLDPMRTILVFSHKHNTYDKKLALNNSNPKHVRKSEKTVASFIRQAREKPIYDFFMEELDAALEAYAPGHPRNKPDVLIKILEIEESRQQMIRDMQRQQPGGDPQCIYMERPGEPPVPLTGPQIVDFINNQKNVIEQQAQKLAELQRLVDSMTQKIRQLNKLIKEHDSRMETKN
jgi:glycosyltransferase involved in cell wall biosynthesis